MVRRRKFRGRQIQAMSYLTLMLKTWTLYSTESAISVMDRQSELAPSATRASHNV